LRLPWLYETRIRRIPIVLLQRLAVGSRLDGGMGQRMGILPTLRQRKDFFFPEQQSACGFLLHVLQRRVRAKEPEGKLRCEGSGWRVQNQVRASSREQQSEFIAHELRHQLTGRRESLYRAKALLRPRYHRRAQTTCGHSATRRMDRLKNLARSRSPLGENTRHSRRCHSRERTRPRGMAEDAFPQER